MRDGCGALDRQQALERHLQPARIRRFPVERRCCHPSRLTIVQPSASQSDGVAIAAVLHEREPFGIGDEPVGEPEGMQRASCAGCSLSQAKALPVVADAMDAAAIADPAERLRLQTARKSRGRALICRAQRICGEERQNVGQQQLLVLLLMIDADLDQARDSRATRPSSLDNTVRGRRPHGRGRRGRGRPTVASAGRAIGRGCRGPWLS